jgi:CBS domain-containing protein
MATVKDLLRVKGTQVWVVKPTTTLKEALQLMAAKKIGAVLVADQGKVVGILSERDFARYVVQEKDFSMDMPVEKMMTSQVYVVATDDSVNECMALMSGKRIRHLPVVENGEIKGVISIGDVVNQIIAEREIQISALENYILGRGYNQ